MRPWGRWSVGILIFDDLEVLDFAGPFEVFSRTRLASLAPTLTVERQARVVDDGVITSAGVAPGMGRVLT